MKKTGKVLSLVLSLALVASSLTATFASAATENATVELASDTVYLSNDSASKSTLTADLTSFLSGSGIESAKSASGVDLTSTGTISLKEIAVASGSSLIAVDSGNTIKLLDNTKTGSALVAARYTGSYTKADGTTASVGGVANLKVVILAKGTVKIGKAADTVATGSTPAALDTLPKNEATANKIDGSVYTLAPDGTGSSALAKWTAQEVVTTAAAGKYFVEKDNAGADLTVSDTTFTLTTNAVAVANTNVNVTAKLGEDAAVKANATTKIENRVAVNISDGAYINGLNGRLYIAVAQTPVDTDVPIDGVDEIENTGAVTVIQGNVKKITTGGELTVNYGSVAEATSVGATINNGSIGKLTSTGAVTVNGGSVATIDADNQTITVDATNDKIAASVGTVEKAATLTVGSASTKAATKVVKATATTINLNGAKASIGTIDTNKAVTTVTYGDDYSGEGVALANVSSEALPQITVASGSDVTYSKPVTAGAINVVGKLTFKDQANIAGLSGSGTVEFVPGKLYTTGNIYGVTLQAAGGKVTAGQTLFTAPLYTVDESGFIGKGFTVKKESGEKLDTFKVDEVTFYGIEFTVTSDKLAVGQTKTYTATAYPVGQPLPEGATIKLTFDGSDDYFSFKDNGNGTATVSALKYENIFTSLNKGTITATLYDSNGYQMYSYSTPTCALTITDKPTYVSDTTGTYNMVVGQSYTFKITASDGSLPPFVVASNGATVAPYTKSGNDYLFKVTGAKVGDYGVYVGGRVCILHITSGIKSDTTKVTIANGKTYQFKITKDAKSASAPQFVVANVGAIKPVDVQGNDYFYKVTNNGKTGDVGVYVNGPKIAVITFTK